jgi:hypothetical protein
MRTTYMEDSARAFPGEPYSCYQDDALKPATSEDVSMVRNVPMVMVALVAVCTTPCLAKITGTNARTPMLTRQPILELSRFYIGAKEGVAWPKRTEAYPSEARFGNDLGANAFTHFAGLLRGIAINADPSSAFEDGSYGQVDLSGPGDPESTADGKGAALAVDLEKGLLKIGMDQLGRDAMQGAVKQAQPFGSVPQQADAAIPGAIANRRPAAFDASEGTLLDPLLNTTYDLNFPKTVPSLK